MQIAIPVKMNKENPALAPLFGKAKWFALVEDGEISIVQNPAHGGQDVIRWFSKLGVDTVIFQEMGVSPYGAIQGHGGMTLYHAGFERIVLSDILAKFENGDLIPLTDAGMEKIIKHHEGKYSHGEGDGHQHH